MQDFILACQLCVFETAAHCNYIVSAEKGHFQKRGADFLLALPSESRFISIAVLKNDIKTTFIGEFDLSRRGTPLVTEYILTTLPSGVHY